MELSRKMCRLCSSETDFVISLHSSYSRKTNLTDKIHVCLKIIIEETESVSMICYKCAHNVEKFYDFLMLVKKAQNKPEYDRQRGFEAVNVNRRVISYAREQVQQVIDADYTFSFLEVPEEKKEASSPFFSYISPHNKQPETLWKAPLPQEVRKEDFKRPKKSRQHSRDFFESQSQEAEEPEPWSLDWKLTPDNNILKRVREKCFGRSDFN